MSGWTWGRLTAAEPELIDLERQAVRDGSDWVRWAAIAIRLDQLVNRWARTASPLRHTAVWRLAWRRLRRCYETGQRPGAIPQVMSGG